MGGVCRAQAQGQEHEWELSADEGGEPHHTHKHSDREDPRAITRFRIACLNEKRKSWKISVNGFKVSILLLQCSLTESRKQSGESCSDTN